MHPGVIAATAPDRPAIIMGVSGESISFLELDAHSNQLAHLFRASGIERGGRIAIFMENNLQFLEVAWAAQRSGLAYTTVNSHLNAQEAAYIIDDCGATLLISSERLAPVATALTGALIPQVSIRLMVEAPDRTLGNPSPYSGWRSYQNAIAAHAIGPVNDECEGDFVLYSSGTTGRPKGIKRPLTLAPMGEGLPGVGPLLTMLGLVDGDVYLCPAPLYHGAGLAWSMAAHRLGATVVVMERFDAQDALRIIEQYSVSHSQWVPTMFVRMLKLDEEVRLAHDLSSHRAAVHSAAPCPISVKHQMIEWWGPIINEYYSATEGIGLTFINSTDWLAHPGSVGKPWVGVPHVLDEAGEELPNGEPGILWFSGGYEFDYHNDPTKTAESRNERGYATVGDIGYVDDDGYVYLTDRAANMIISGGVNIYPQEAENILVTHPKVFDVAVFGVPNSDLGEEVKAVVQPADWASAGPELEAELLEFVQEHLSLYKCPRSIDFERELPRLDTGKLYKRLLKEKYWAEQ